jgi:hypothetical protein
MEEGQSFPRADGRYNPAPAMPKPTSLYYGPERVRGNPKALTPPLKLSLLGRDITP